jgi:excisionase family DNA binding protein
MSSNIRIVKTCEFCKNAFVAKTTVTQCCSDDCAKRLYKQKIRNSMISQAVLKTEIKRKPEAYITSEKLQLINEKEILDLKEAAMLLNVSPLTLRRWVLSGKYQSHKAGKKHLFAKTAILQTLNK